MSAFRSTEQTAFYRRNLYIVLGVACALRLLAVIFARGYLAHDDFFETVRIALDWAHGNLWDANGLLYWHGAKSGGLMRSPVYNFFLAGLLKSGSAMGLSTLAAQMFLIRSVHALISLLPVYFGYRYVTERTNPETGLTAGLVLAAFFPLPFFSVRTLIGVVAGNLLVPGLYYADRAWRENRLNVAVWAGLWLGAAWLIRPPVEIVAIPILLILLGLKFRWRLALALSLPIAAIVAVEGLLEIPATGRYLGAMLNYIPADLGEPIISGPWYRYLLLILGVFIPPFSIWMIVAMLRPEVIRRYAVWWWSTAVFLAVHSYYSYKQERFIFPIIGPLIVIGVLSLASLDRTRWFGGRRFRRVMWTYFWVVNTALLIVFTFTYSHRGRVEPFVYLGEQHDVRGVIVDCTKRWVFTPQHYAGYPPPPAVVVEQYPDSASAFMRDTANYLVIFADAYPLTSMERWNNLAGPFELAHECPPSLLDRFLQWVNPKYNFANRSWVFRKRVESP